jgi:hypothetical protein
MDKTIARINIAYSSLIPAAATASPVMMAIRGRARKHAPLVCPHGALKKGCVSLMILRSKVTRALR